MENTAAFQLVKKTLTDKKVNTTELIMENHLQNDLEFDDLDTVELAMDLEGELQQSISDEDVAQWNTVGDVVRTVEKFIK